MNWNPYYESVKTRPPSRLLAKAMGYIETKGAALDLGAGMLSDTMEMLEAGFGRVLAVDRSIQSEKAAAEIRDARLRFSSADFSALSLQNSCFDLVLARDALFFCEETELEILLAKIWKSLRPNGIFAADFLAEKDDWNGREDIFCISVVRIKELVQPWADLQFFETEFNAPSAEGVMKHWHYVKYIGKKVTRSRPRRAKAGRGIT